jgi:hypothetical protein
VPPIVYVVPEIGEKALGSNEFISYFLFTFVLVVAFACLVVIAKDTNTIHHKRQTILE